MLVPGTVKAGDKLVYVRGNNIKTRKVVEVAKVTSTGNVVQTFLNIGHIHIENGEMFYPDGLKLGINPSHAELFPYDAV